VEVANDLAYYLAENNIAVKGSVELNSVVLTDQFWNCWKLSKIVENCWKLL